MLNVILLAALAMSAVISCTRSLKVTMMYLEIVPAEKGSEARRLTQFQVSITPVSEDAA